GHSLEAGFDILSPNGEVMERRARQPNHSGFMPANLTTLPHFSVSSAMSLPHPAGDSASTVPSSSASRALIFGSASAELISLFSLSMISVGVFLGAPRASQRLASNPGTNSATFGRSGSASKRAAAVTANARRLPVLTCSIERTVGANMA